MVNAEFFDALEQLEKEKGIPVDYMLDRVGQALITAYKRDNDGMTDNVYVEPDRDKKTIHMFVRKTVVKAEDLYEPYEEITLEEAAEYKNNPMVGDIIDIDIPTKSFGRIAAQTAKQVIIQGIREAERGMVISEFESKEHEILNGVVARIDPRSGTAYLDVVSGGEKSEAVLAASEQVRGEVLTEGQRLKVYLIEVRRGTRNEHTAGLVVEARLAHQLVAVGQLAGTACQTEHSQNRISCHLHPPVPSAARAARKPHRALLH